MKSKKLLLPSIILVSAIVVMAAYSIISSIAFKPTVTEGEFPFSVTYELDGERVTVEDVYKVNYVKNDKDDNHKGRVYVGTFGNDKNNTTIILKRDENTRIELSLFLYADHLMGDPEYDYFDDMPFAPRIYYYDANETEYYDDETLAAQGVKLISFEYPEPIKNSLEFSHISYLTGISTLPLLLVAFLSLIVTVIFVKKEKELKYKTVDIVSIVLNFLLAFTLLPFVTIVALFIDVEGGGPELYYQVCYFIPAVVVLCTTASIGLRRKGYGAASLVAELVGPASFVTYLIVFYLGAMIS